VLDEALGLLDDHLGHLDVARGWLVERGRDDLPLDRPLHVGDLFGPLVPTGNNEQHDQVHLGVVRRDAVRDVLEQHRLAGSRRCDDEAARPLADRRHQVHDARRQVVGRRLEVDPLLGVERRQVLEEDLLARLLRRLEVDRLDLDEREVASPSFGGRICPDTVSPVCRSNFRIWDGET
jgi:hypothetical protein